MAQSQTNTTPSPKKIAWATAAAFAVAVLVVVGAILPAEYGLDPLGTGRAFGLLALSRVQPIDVESGEYMTDVLELRLAPTEWVESTYELEEGASMLFSWEASGVVSYNFHSAPDGSPPGYAESYDAQVSDRAHGAYTAPFTGVHGWYWENQGEDYVTIQLTTAGFYARAHQARDRVSGYRPLRNARGEPLDTSEDQR